MGYRLHKTAFVSETLLVSKGSLDLLQSFHTDIAESLIDQVSILSFLSSFCPFWAVCDALLLEKESSPACSFHLAVLLLNTFNLLPVVVWQKNGAPGVFILLTLENLLTSYLHVRGIPVFHISVSPIFPLLCPEKDAAVHIWRKLRKEGGWSLGFLDPVLSGPEESALPVPTEQPFSKVS